MKLIPWKTGSRVNPFDSFFDGLFDTAPWQTGSTAPRERWAPVNVFETEKAFVIEVELPGVDEKDVEVKLNGDELTITAERKHDKETKAGDYHRVESHFGRFSRTLRLPDSLESAAIEAKFKRGVLTLTVPKAPERTPQRIAIKSE